MGPDLPMGPPSLRGDWRQGAEPLCRRTQLSQKRCKELECLEGQKCWKQWNPMAFQGSEKEVCLFDCEPGFEWTEYSCGCKKRAGKKICTRGDGGNHEVGDFLSNVALFLVNSKLSTIKMYYI